MLAQLEEKLVVYASHITDPSKKAAAKRNIDQNIREITKNDASSNAAEAREWAIFCDKSGFFCTNDGDTQ